MKRIDESVAKQYIPCGEDYLDGGIKNATYFTLTPSDEGDGWEDVTYYTSRKHNMYSNREGSYDSWVYILSNPSLPNIFKIGYTTNSPEERAKQISSSTGVVLPYKVEYAFRCWSGEKLEHEIHKYLDSYRVNNQREFFQIEFDQAKTIIERIGQRYI
jgi:hypothetical protein